MVEKTFKMSELSRTEMKTEELNERYSVVYIKWNDKIQSGTYCYTIQEALEIIKMLSGYNNTGIYHIVTPYCKYEITNIFEMECKKIETF